MYKAIMARNKEITALTTGVCSVFTYSIKDKSVLSRSYLLPGEPQRLVHYLELWSGLWCTVSERQEKGCIAKGFWFHELHFQIRVESMHTFL